MLFGQIDDNQKDQMGSFADNEQTPVVKGIKSIKKEFPNLQVICDVCICAYSTHGHCGILDEQNLIDNQKSIDRLSDIAVNLVKFGADLVSPSDMMDGRIKMIKDKFQKQGLNNGVIAYSAKFASKLYAPFRDVCQSSPMYYNRQNYQIPLDNQSIALKAIQRDISEGADYVIVKPITHNLDIVTKAKQQFNTVIIGYVVLGEYCMVECAQKHLDKKAVLMEQLQCLKRAQVDVVISYHAPDLLQYFKEQ